MRKDSIEIFDIFFVTKIYLPVVRLNIPYLCFIITARIFSHELTAYPFLV